MISDGMFHFMARLAKHTSQDSLSMQSPTGSSWDPTQASTNLNGATTTWMTLQ